MAAKKGMKQPNKVYRDFRLGLNCIYCNQILIKENVSAGTTQRKCQSCYDQGVIDGRRDDDSERRKERCRQHYYKNREKYIERAQKNARENPDRVRLHACESRMRIKMQMIEAYGGKCVCCGETGPAFLTIDHIDNDGALDRASGRLTGVNLYRSLKRSGWPKDKFQLLCMNCNCAKGMFGECPHKFMKEDRSRLF